jgi:VanZ family protein
MGTALRGRLWQGVLLAALLAYSTALAVGSLTPISRESELAATALHRAVNNLLHVPAYTGLTFLCAAALGAFRATPSFGRDYALGAAAAVLFGGAMELAQLRVPGRWCSFGDLMLDVAGAALAAPLVWGWCRRTVRVLARRHVAGEFERSGGLHG